jgi:RNA polymerase sigma-70 factor (ECF subfamily)
VSSLSDARYVAIPEPIESTSADPELAWIEAARSDPAAFAPLYHRYATSIYRYLWRQVRDEDDANDLTAQVFTRAIEHIHQYRPRPGGTFRAWLFAIARNALTDHWRRARPSAPFDPAGSAAHDPDPLPEERASHRDEFDRLLRALGQLPASQRAMIELRLEGLTTAEIAAALDLTVPAVKTAQTRAYKRLRTLLQEPGGHER